MSSPRKSRPRTAQRAANHNGRPLEHLNQKQLARRWSLSTRSLERWRALGQGPIYLKLGGRVVYRLEDVEAFEAVRFHESTATQLRAPR